MSGALHNLIAGQSQAQLDNRTIYRGTTAGLQASIRLQLDGTADEVADGTGGLWSEFMEWLPGGADAGSWEVYAAHSGDALQVGSDSTGAWLALSSERNWHLSNPVNLTTVEAVLTISFRAVGSGAGTGIISGVITLQCENT